jgi:hypothetical protein
MLSFTIFTQKKVLLHRNRASEIKFTDSFSTLDIMERKPRKELSHVKEYSYLNG